MINSRPNKILVIRLSSLGDILLTTPLVRSLKKRGIQIDYLLREQYADTIRHNPNISSLWFYNEKPELIGSLVSEGYSAVIDLQNNLRSRRITGKLNCPVYRFKKHSLDKFLLVRFKINRLKDLPQIPERYALAAEDVLEGFRLDAQGLEIFLPEGVTTSLAADKDYVGLCPGARHTTKQWPEQYYIQLGRLLAEKGFTPVLFGGKSDIEICGRIAREVPGAVDLSSDNQLFQTAADMRSCRAVVCNDSGLMHTACAAGVPVVSIFGSTVKEFGFAPYKNSGFVIENEGLACRPCTHIGREKCPLGHFKCMKEISVGMVFEKLSRLTA